MDACGKKLCDTCAWVRQGRWVGFLRPLLADARSRGEVLLMVDLTQRTDPRESVEEAIDFHFGSFEKMTRHAFWRDGVAGWAASREAKRRKRGRKNRAWNIHSHLYLAVGPMMPGESEEKCLERWRAAIGKGWLKATGGRGRKFRVSIVQFGMEIAPAFYSTKPMEIDLDDVADFAEGSHRRHFLSSGGRWRKMERRKSGEGPRSAVAGVSPIPVEEIERMADAGDPVARATRVDIWAWCRTKRLERRLEVASGVGERGHGLSATGFRVDRSDGSAEGDEAWCGATPGDRVAAVAGSGSDR